MAAKKKQPKQRPRAEPADDEEPASESGSEASDGDDGEGPTLESDEDIERAAAIEAAVMAPSSITAATDHLSARAMGLVSRPDRGPTSP